MPDTLEKGDALLIVDVQNDFMPGGALPVPEGDAIVPIVNRWIEAARDANIPIYASRDWHPFNHVSFKEEGGPWPVHCVADTRGAAFHPDVNFKDDVIILNKAEKPDVEAYSAFQGTDLTERLRAAGIERLWIGGLALDYCVRASALDAANAGFDVHLILPAARAINEETRASAIEEMREAGVTVEESSPV